MRRTAVGRPAIVLALAGIGVGCSATWPGGAAREQACPAHCVAIREAGPYRVTAFVVGPLRTVGIDVTNRLGEPKRLTVDSIDARLSFPSGDVRPFKMYAAHRVPALEGPGDYAYSSRYVTRSDWTPCASAEDPTLTVWVPLDDYDYEVRFPLRPLAAVGRADTPKTDAPLALDTGHASRHDL